MFCVNRYIVPYFFEPVPNFVGVKKGTLTYTVWSINIYKEEKEDNWNFEEAKRKAEEVR